MGSITAMLARVSRALGGSGNCPQTSHRRSAVTGELVLGFMVSCCPAPVSGRLPPRHVLGTCESPAFSYGECRAQLCNWEDVPWGVCPSGWNPNRGQNP